MLKYFRELLEGREAEEEETVLRKEVSEENDKDGQTDERGDDKLNKDIQSEKV